jgi:ABC-type transport system substrate-binding protein
VPCAAAGHSPASVGTGPFKFVSYQPNELMADAKPGLLNQLRPYLDGIEWSIIEPVDGAARLCRGRST